MCDTKDLKSPKSPLNYRIRGKVNTFTSYVRKVSPVVRLRGSGFLVSKEPSMTVCGVNEVQVPPDEWSGRYRELRLREQPLCMLVNMVVVLLTRARECAGEECEKSEERW